MDKNNEETLNIEPTIGSENSILGDTILKLIDERLNVSVSSKGRKSKEYRAVVEREAKLLNRLKSTLVTDEQKELIDNLEVIGCRIGELSQEFAYRQGLQDAPTITKEFNEFIAGRDPQ